ncbi:hypothetical protein Bca52824_001851 [Brassica carinata]|uniref:TF-B3 domain-containing protein n=1 Tax=Brassica carinata TaxID=52824 RepID=A0A8X7WJD7_BRACI|nr:hypothetical protein Bca52824_001851 [Brassica carinata]
MWHIPRKFTKGNKLKPGEIILLDKDGATYKMMLEAKREQRHKYLQIKDPIVWENFCLANGVKAGESLTLELTERRELKFFSKVMHPSPPPRPREMSHFDKDVVLTNRIWTGLCEIGLRMFVILFVRERIRYPVFSDPLQHKLEMLQRKSDIKKKYREADSLLIAEGQSRRAELYEQFKRKQADVEAEPTAKNSELTSSFLLFSDPFQLELEKLEIRN